MENPATWGKAEQIISRELRQADADRRRGIIGLSRARRVAGALREAGLLREQAEQPYARQARPGGE